MAPDRNSPEPTPLWCSTRLTLAFVSFLGFVNLYALRVNLSVAMVCMVNQTYVTSLHHNNLNTNNNFNNSSNNISLTASDAGDDCGIENTDSGGGRDDSGGAGDKEGEFLWPKETQGLILGSFFWGYLVTQVPGGWLASRYGGKRVLGYFMGVCSLLTLLMPLAARTDFRFLIVLRILAGMCQGVVWPAMQLLWTFWAPPLETGKLAGFCYAGSQVGNVLTFPIAGLLCEYGFDGGWPSIFYVFGSLGLVWFVLWTFLVFDSPQCHPRISPEEKHYITSSLKGRRHSSSAVSPKNTDIPWVKIFTCRAVWAIVLTHMCANWGTYTFLTNIPTYMKEVLRFDIKQNGLLSSLPYIGFWLMANVSGVIFDFVQSRGWLTTTWARKVSNTMGEICPGLLVIAVGFVDCSNPVLGVALLTVGVSMCGFQYGGGFLVNAGDIAPQYAGIIFGISNTFATIPGFLAPIAIGIITREQTQEQWRTVFFISAAIYTCAALVYIVLGSGNLQSWARPDTAPEDVVTPAEITKTKDGILLESGKDNGPESTTLLSGNKSARDTAQSAL